MAANEPAEAKILVLRDPETQQFQAVANADADETDKAVSDARLRKAIFEHRVSGAKTRAGMLPRQLTAALSGGVTNLMLAKILQEEIVPGSAKEASDVAKVAHEIFMKSSGTANPKDLSPAERQARQDEVTKLEHALAERAKAATAQLGGALPEGVSPAAADEDPQVWEHDEVPDPD